jgi:prephenate dehydratase
MVAFTDRSKKMIIGFLGPSGTFTEEAANKVSGNYMAYNSIQDVLEALNKNKIDLGVVPIENSVEGSVGITLDSMAHDYSFNIQREIILPIRHYLLLNPDSKMDDLKQIYSHPQALSQCRHFIKKLGVSTRATESTAIAAKIIKGDKYSGAIGNLKLAEIYNLKIASKDIQDYSNNTTRFLVLGCEESLPTGKDKTSIVFSIPEDHPGGLYEILGEFAKRNINLSKIESRPSKERLGSYIFFLDFEGHITDEVIRNVLNIIKSKVGYVKILGSYPNEGED